MDPFRIPNIQRFIRFRVFFNARYYYSIFTVLFLDYGLSLESFAALNILWAITIALAEVPSGALADIIGRKNLLVTGAVLMCIEMAVLLIAPINGGLLTISLFAVNRIASGLAEAAVSGADEALAFESLKGEGLESKWPEVLERVGKRLSIMMAFAMIVGSLVYDHSLFAKAFALLGIEDKTPAANFLIRLPIALTFCHALYVLKSALGMTEPPSLRDHEPFSLARLNESFLRIFEAGKWILDQRFVLFVILGGLILDSTARQFVILGSEYYRQIKIPEFAFGFLSASFALLGFLTAKFSKYLATQQSPFRNLCILSALLLFGLYGIQSAIPYLGVLFVFPVIMIFSAVGFLQSTYINREVDSSQRATVLSFKGLALNLGMSIASIAYILAIAAIKKGYPAETPLDALQDHAFIDALAWFPRYYIVLLLLLLVAGRYFIRKKEPIFS